jgi:hypothetical protein
MGTGDAGEKKQRAGTNAEKGVAYCDKLFHFEKQFALLTPENRVKERERLSRPMMDEFFNWIDSLSVLPGSLLGKAVYYAKSQRIWANQAMHHQSWIFFPEAAYCRRRCSRPSRRMQRLKNMHGRKTDEGRKTYGIYDRFSL